MSPLIPIVVIVVCGLVHTEAAGGSHWSYSSLHPGGPSGWSKDYPKCSGRKQSPINIQTTRVREDPRLKPFYFRGYDKTSGVYMTLKNAGGHTAQVDISGSPLYIHGGSLPAQYKLAQIHFHWGSSFSGKGSEHTINGHSYPMEMHLVHTRHGREASKPNGLAVIGFFFKLGAHNEHLDVLIQNLLMIANAGDSTPLINFSVHDLLPEGESLGYFRYRGSLTTPPCHESVIWSVMKSTIPISRKQLAMFSTLRKPKGERLFNNFRPTQPLNQRFVLSTMWKTENEEEMENSYGRMHPRSSETGAMEHCDMGHRP